MTLLGPLIRRMDAVAVLLAEADTLGIPVEPVQAPADYPWSEEFLLVRPDQHIAWRASNPSDIDLRLVTGR
jgi:aromatic ring hydroxylase-like protein